MDDHTNYFHLFNDVIPTAELCNENVNLQNWHVGSIWTLELANSLGRRSVAYTKIWDFHYHHHYHHISFMELGHLLTRSGLTYPEVSSKVYHDSLCQLGSSISLTWVIYFYFEAFYLRVVSSFSFIPVTCPKLVLFLTPLQFVHFFCNLSKCILLLGFEILTVVNLLTPNATIVVVLHR